MSNSTPTLRTVGVIAAELGVPVHRISYLLKSRRFIRPTAFAGRLRVFDRESIEAIRRELDVMNAKDGI